MKMIKKVRMVFADVNYPVSERSIKESVILTDFDELLYIYYNKFFLIFQIYSF